MGTMTEYERVADYTGAVDEQLDDELNELIETPWVVDHPHDGLFDALSEWTEEVQAVASPQDDAFTRVYGRPEAYVSEVLPPTDTKLDIVVNHDQVDRVLGTLMAAYEANSLPYSLDRVRVPHDPRHMPPSLERGTKEHAMFLFNVCYYMRGGIKSNDAVKRMSQVYEAWPELFNCEEAQYFDEETLVDILKSHGLGFHGSVPGQWIKNSRRMQELYDGDPRQLFDGVSTYEKAQERLQNRGKKGFLGFQEKMTSMITYYLMDDGLIEPFNFPIPIDLHVARVSIANELVSVPNAPHGTNLYTSDMLAVLRQIYFEYAERSGVNPLRLCDAVWMLSESSCGRNPGNTTIEPNGRDQRNGRATMLYPKRVDIFDKSQQQAYQASCAVCPVQDTCEFNIPGTHYYVGGNLIIRGRRVRFPAVQQVVQPPLFDL